MFFLELGREAMAASFLYLFWQALPVLIAFRRLQEQRIGRPGRTLALELLCCLGLELLGRLLLSSFIQALLP